MNKPSEFNIPENDVSEQTLYQWRSKALSIILMVIAITSFPAYASVVINAIQNYNMTWREYIYLAVYVGTVGLALFPKLDLKYKSLGIMVLTYTNAITSFARLGLVGSGRLWLIVMPIIAIILISAKAGYFTAGFSIFIYITFSILVKMGVLENWLVLKENPITMGYWIEGGTALTVFLTTLVILVERFSDLQQRSFNDAQQSNLHLVQITQALRESDMRFRMFMDHFPGLAYIKDSATKILFANQCFQQYLHIDASKIVGKVNADTFPPEFAKKITADDHRVLDSGQNQEIEEVFGGRTWATYKFIIPQENQPPMLGGLTLDITERKTAEENIRWLNEELERRVIERTAQFEAANKELESFTYSVSHDLRAPLRAIDGYSRIILEDYSAALNDEAREIFSVIRHSTQRMNQLIDDLLAFSRVQRAEMQPASIDMQTLVNTVFLELTSPKERERIDLFINELPCTQGDLTLMRQVWENLIGNAIKFSSKKERAILEIGSQTNNSEIIYFIRDNGAGFDMQYASKLFGVFQRLHTEKEFEGTGVGLAIVQKVIQQHGGRVWAEGEVENGAIFYFSLPQVIP